MLAEPLRTRFTTKGTLQAGLPHPGLLHPGLLHAGLLALVPVAETTKGTLHAGLLALARATVA